MRLLLLPTLLLATLPVSAKEIPITLMAGKQDRINTPVCVPLSLSREEASSRSVTLAGPGSLRLTGQLTGPSLLTESVAAESGQVRRDLHFVVPQLKAGETLALVATLSDTSTSGFTWRESPGAIELVLDDRPVLRYMNAVFDDSSKEKREETFKVYHHLFDFTGKSLLTKGPGGLFTHHRGLFYGFKAKYGTGTVADTWHCPPPGPKSLEAHLPHEKVLASDVGAVLGRHRVQIGWHGKGKERFAVEERELTVFNISGGRMVEFASRLTPVEGSVKLDGDPQHAGFHFRASNEVADKTKGETYYLRPDGKDKPGATRNWPQTKTHVNLPWNAMSFMVGGKRYTAAYLDRPGNPKEARFSERDYGRFGSYFVAEATKEKPLTVAYRLWLQEGEMTEAEIAARSGDYVTPPETRWK